MKYPGIWSCVDRFNLCSATMPKSGHSRVSDRTGTLAAAWSNSADFSRTRVLFCLVDFFTLGADVSCSTAPYGCLQ